MAGFDSMTERTCKHCGKPVYPSNLGVGPAWIHHEPLRMNCFLGEPWTTPEPNAESAQEIAR